jgi:methyl-accepting chemotaxis protein
MAPDPNVSPEGMTSEFNKAVENIKQCIQRTRDEFDKLVGNIKKWAWALSAPIILWIKNRLEELKANAEKLLEKAVWVVEHAGGIPSLILMAFRWLTVVQKPASSIGGQIVATDDMLVYWEGQAADLYAKKIPIQQLAANDMATKADFISTWLFTIAKANVEYAVKLSENISMLVGEIAQAAIDAAGVFTILEAVNTVAGAAGSLIENALNVLFNIANNLVDALKNMRDANSSMNNLSNLPGPPAGTWPQAVRVPA